MICASALGLVAAMSRMRPWISTDLPLPGRAGDQRMRLMLLCAAEGRAEIEIENFSVELAQADHEGRVQTRGIAVQFAPRPDVPQRYDLPLRTRHRDHDLARQGRHRDEAQTVRRQQGRLLGLDVFHPKAVGAHEADQAPRSVSAGSPGSWPGIRSPTTRSVASARCRRARLLQLRISKTAAEPAPRSTMQYLGLHPVLACRQAWPRVRPVRQTQVRFLWAQLLELSVSSSSAHPADLALLDSVSRRHPNPSAFIVGLSSSLSARGCGIRFLPKDAVHPILFAILPAPCEPHRP